MRQCTGGNSGHLLRLVVCSKHLDLIESTHCDIGKLTLAITHNIDVIGQWPSIQQRHCVKRWRSINDLCLAYIFQCQPNLLAVWRGGNIRAKWRCLFDATDNLMRVGIKTRIFGDWEGTTPLTVI